MNYSQKLKDPRWKALRFEAVKRDGFKCCSCGGDGDGEPFEVHHLVYRKEPWDAPLEDLETLCRFCHELREGINDVYKKMGFKRNRCPTFLFTAMLWMIEVSHRKGKRPKVELMAREFPAYTSRFWLSLIPEPAARFSMVREGAGKCRRMHGQIQRSSAEGACCNRSGYARKALLSGAHESIRSL